MDDVVTYSPSATIALTRACANKCLYCGFREDGGGLLPFVEIQNIARQARDEKISEILVISGENAGQDLSVRGSLRSLGLNSMVQWAREVCEYLLGLDLLPHINIGVLDYSGLRELRDVSASMGLMMEGDYGILGSTIHPQKDFSRRIQNLEWAGELKIPFTTGILMGVGDSQKDRIRSIQSIIRCCKTYRHVQEIILQNYVPNRLSCVPAHEVSTEDLKEIMGICKDEIPDVSLQVPPNLNLNWPDLLPFGLNDLGGIGRRLDLVNSGSPWPSVKGIVTVLKEKRCLLRKRLPIYPKYYQQGWYSEKVGSVVQKWVEGVDEYRYYTQ